MHQSIRIRVAWLALTLIGIGEQAQAGWEHVGAAGFATGTYLSLALDSNDTPYLAFSDADNSDKAKVLRFSNGSWTQVGSSHASSGAATFLNLAVDNNGVPYLAFSDGDNGKKLRVVKLDNNNSWVTVGGALVTSSEVADISLALDSSGKPSVAYSECMDTYCFDTQASIMTLNGATWGAYNGVGLSIDATLFVSLALNSSSGVPYLAYTYQDVDGSDRVSITTYNAAGWVDVGTAGFAEVIPSSIQLALNSSGVPYVAFSDMGNGGKASLMQFDGTTWLQAGSAAASDDIAWGISLTLNASGQPYLAYNNIGTNGKARVRKLNGSVWEDVGTANFSPDDVDNINLALSRSGTPYLAYSDLDSKISLMQFNSNSSRAMPWLDLLLRKK